MKDKGFIKIALSLLIAILIVATIGNLMFTYATDNFDVSKFEGDDKTNASIDTPVERITGVAVLVIRTVGLGVAIIMITVMAMKYMLAAPSERADFKKSSIQYVIGAIVVFGATNILTIIIEFVEAAVSDNSQNPT